MCCGALSGQLRELELNLNFLKKAIRNVWKMGRSLVYWWMGQVWSDLFMIWINLQIGIELIDIVLSELIK